MLYNNANSGGIPLKESISSNSHITYQWTGFSSKPARLVTRDARLRVLAITNVKSVFPFLHPVNSARTTFAWAITNFEKRLKYLKFIY